MSSLPQNRNAVWDRVLVDALIASGVRRFILCPGGRNGLLAMTLQRSPQAECIQHIDERSAGFLALGLILADEAPTAVCTTSGSATANLVPAMTEASARGMPLVLVTCDRPLSGRMAHEPQTVAQDLICGPLARTQLLLPDPLNKGAMNLTAMRDAVSASIIEGCHSDRPGPTHINVPQWGDYCATEDDPCELKPCPPPAEHAHLSVRAKITDIEQALAKCDLSSRPRGIVLAGQDMPISLEALRGFLIATGFPLIADVCSGLRHHELPGIITTADAQAEAGVLDVSGIDIMIRLGGAPVSPGLSRTIKQYAGPTIAIAHSDPGPDFLTPNAVGLLPPCADGMAALGKGLGQASPEWSQEWAMAEMLADAGRGIAGDALPWGELCAARQVFNASGFDFLHCANSLSVRYAGLLVAAGKGHARTFTARGVNGTDGTLGLLLGEALACEGAMLALLGDQAFVHDLPALSNPRWRELRGAICVMNNSGGGIFDLTAARNVEDYGATMRNPPEIDFSGIAAAFGIEHRQCTNRDDLAQALENAAQGEHPHLIEILVAAQTPLRDLPSFISTIGRSAAAMRGVDA